MTAPALDPVRKAPATPEPADDRGRWASAGGAVVLLAGVVGIASGLLPAQRGRLHVVAELLGLPVASAAAAGSIVVGVVLVLLARGLGRRQRRAWVISVPLLAVAAGLHLIKGLDLEEALVSLAALALLVWTRAEFGADPDPGERSHPLRLAAGLAAFSVLAGLLELRLNAGSVVGSPSLATQLSHVVQGLVGIQGPVQLRSDRAGDLVAASLLGLGLLTAALPVARALALPSGRVGLTPSQAQAVRTLLATPGESDSLGYFALRDDKDVLLSGRGGAVSYRVHAGVAIASGDPLGDPGTWPGAIADFLALAASHGWTPAVLGCSERGGSAYAKAGLSALEIGDEAVLDVASFSLQGRQMRGVRQAVHRVQRAGVTTRVRRVSDLSELEIAELRAAADWWREGPVERGFSMALGRLGGPLDGRCVVVEAHRDGQLLALLHFVPWADDGLSLDLMRRKPGTENGLNELLITAALLDAPRLGVTRVSLNFAVFRSALEQGARLGAGPVLRAWRGVLLFASRFWQIDSLYRFNDKFGPEWEPRYVCYRRGRDLPRVIVASLQAEAFLPRPAWLPRWL